MKKIILSIYFVIVWHSIFGQIADNTDRKNEKNIYNQSFIQYFKYLEKENYQVPDTIFIEKNLSVTDSLLTSIGKTKLVLIEMSEVEKIVIKNKGITMYRLFPLKYIKHEFSVVVVPFGVTYSKENGLFFSTSGSYWVYFEFRNGIFKFQRIGDYQI